MIQDVQDEYIRPEMNKQQYPEEHKESSNDARHTPSELRPHKIRKTFV